MAKKEFWVKRSKIIKNSELTKALILIISRMAANVEINKECFPDTKFRYDTGTASLKNRLIADFDIVADTKEVNSVLYRLMKKGKFEIPESLWPSDQQSSETLDRPVLCGFLTLKLRNIRLKDGHKGRFAVQYSSL